MHQMSLAQRAEFQRFAKKTRREEFLEEMDAAMTWAELSALVETFSPRRATADKACPERSRRGGPRHHAADLLSAALALALRSRRRRRYLRFACTARLCRRQPITRPASAPRMAIAGTADPRRLMHTASRHLMHRVQPAIGHPLPHRHLRRQQRQLAQDMHCADLGDAGYADQQQKSLPQQIVGLNEFHRLTTHLRRREAVFHNSPRQNT